MPLRWNARRTLVQKLWGLSSYDPDDDKRNKHRLVRPYLGRRRPNLRGEEEGEGQPRRAIFKPVSLRNCPVHIDQLEKLGLNGKEYALAMADGLAFLLWVCELDAGDVEFLIARPRPVRYPGEDCIFGGRAFRSSRSGGILGQHEMWILDFDCCKRIPMTPEGVNMAVERFWSNDPFYPNPGRGVGRRNERDEVLWKVFKERFLETSEKVMQLKCGLKGGDGGGEGELQKSLPGRFLKRVEETAGVNSRGIPRTAGA